MCGRRTPATGQYREESTWNRSGGGLSSLPWTHRAENSGNAKSTGQKPHETRRSPTFPQLWRPVWKAGKFLLTAWFFRAEPHVFKR